MRVTPDDAEFFPSPGSFPGSALTGAERRRSVAAASAAVDRRQASASRLWTHAMPVWCGAAPYGCGQAGGLEPAARLPAFRFLSFFFGSFVRRRVPTLIDPDLHTRIDLTKARIRTARSWDWRAKNSGREQKRSARTRRCASLRAKRSNPAWSPKAARPLWMASSLSLLAMTRPQRENESAFSSIAPGCGEKAKPHRHDQFGFRHCRIRFGNPC